MRVVEQPVGRRSFLKQASLFLVTVSTLHVATLSSFGCGAGTQATYQPTSSTDANVPWKIVTVADGEAGEPLIVKGTIFAPDGKTPLPGINLYVYQTDATGRYSTSGGENRNTRIHGLMRTNDKGQYEFRTIKPGSYPGSTVPAHIHAYVSGPGYPEYWIDEYWFDTDPFVTADMRSRISSQGAFSAILTLKRNAEGLWEGVRDIKIEKCSRNCTGR